MPIKVSDITDTVTYGDDFKKTYQKVFEDIGNHFLNNADRMSENIVGIHAGMKIEIDVPINGVVLVTTKIDEYVIKPNTIEIIVEKAAGILANKNNDVSEEK